MIIWEVVIKIKKSRNSLPGLVSEQISMIAQTYAIRLVTPCLARNHIGGEMVEET